MLTLKSPLRDSLHIGDVFGFHGLFLKAISKWIENILQNSSKANFSSYIIFWPSTCQLKKLNFGLRLSLLWCLPIFGFLLLSRSSFFNDLRIHFGTFKAVLRYKRLLISFIF